MHILLNGEHFELPSTKTLSSLIDELDLAGSRYAIEVNQEIIPRSEHAAFALSDGDKVEVVQAIGGG